MFIRESLGTRAVKFLGYNSDHLLRSDNILRDSITSIFSIICLDEILSFFISNLSSFLSIVESEGTNNIEPPSVSKSPNPMISTFNIELAINMLDVEDTLTPSEQ